MSRARVELDGVPIDYADVGSGPTLVFVHGAYVTGALWDDVVATLSATHRCVVPTFPFGAQTRPVGDADLGVRASGRRIFALLEALDLNDATIIANDTGGGIVLATLGDSTLDLSRAARFVFTNCDSFEHFPPQSFAPIVRLCALSQTLGTLVLRGLATRPGRKVFASAVTRNGINTARQPAIFGRFLNSPHVRRDAARFTAELNPRYTLGAVQALKSWQKPVLMAWGDGDKVFPLAHARRLAETFTNGEVRVIEGSSTYVMLDQPGQTSTAIKEFVSHG